MSVRIMAQVWALELPDSEKLVLLALADCANDEGHCWPGMASLARKCTKGERTVQVSLRSLEAAGHLTRCEIPGKGCNYTIHPRSRCTPAETAPAQGLQKPPQRLRPTPAAAAPKPSKNHKQPSNSQRRAIPDNWWPKDFGLGTQSRKVVAGWPPGELEAQVEQFKANHRAKGNTFLDPQDAFSTWVLNTRKFGIGRHERSHNPTSDAVHRILGSG